jgi:hypothetical protein
MHPHDKKGVGIGSLLAGFLGLVKGFSEQVLSSLGIQVKPGGFLAHVIALVNSVPLPVYATLFILLGLIWCFWNTLNVRVPRVVLGLINSARTALRRNPLSGDRQHRWSHLTLICALLASVISIFLSWTAASRSEASAEQEAEQKLFKTATPPVSVDILYADRAGGLHGGNGASIFAFVGVLNPGPPISFIHLDGSILLRGRGPVIGDNDRVYGAWHFAAPGLCMEYGPADFLTEKIIGHTIPQNDTRSGIMILTFPGVKWQELTAAVIATLRIEVTDTSQSWHTSSPYDVPPDPYPGVIPGLGKPVALSKCAKRK